VTIVARPAHVAAVRRDGLRVVERDGSTWLARPAAVVRVGEAALRPDDTVLLTVKCYDTAAVVTDLAAATSRLAAVACVQNGVANEATVATRFQPIYGVVARFSARLLEPGVVLAAGNRELEFGRYPAGVDETATALAERARNAGITAQTRDDVMAAKWSKLVMNCANAIYAICNVPVQRARSDPDVARLVNLVWAEAEATLAAAGIAHQPVAPLPLPEPLTAEPVAPAGGGTLATGSAGMLAGNPAREREAAHVSVRAAPLSPDPSPTRGEGSVDRRADGPVGAAPRWMHYAGHAGAYYGSTWDDLARGSGKSELPWLNGEIVRLAERHGVRAPANTYLLRTGMEMAARREPPGRCTPAALLAAVSRAGRAER
jgi:2-dehydropantoate 2-reductase